MTNSGGSSSPRFIPADEGDDDTDGDAEGGDENDGMADSDGSELGD